MKQITINGRTVTIKCTMRTICNFEAQTGKKMAEVIDSMEEPTKHLDIILDFIDVLCGEPISEQMDEFKDFNVIMAACSEELHRFFKVDKSAEKPEEDKEDEEKNA